MQIIITGDTLHLHLPTGGTQGAISIDTRAAAAAPPAPSPKATALQPPAAGEYWADQGGYFICTQPALLGLPARHLIFGDLEHDELAYGPYEDIEGARSQLDGAANTRALLAASDEHQAAKWAATYTADGHTDFHLPSRVDLLMAYVCAPQLFKKSGWYWSSTQTSRYNAFVQAFEDGGSNWDDKDDRHRARACRWIPLTA
ncbi:DUF1566 domain-containing protein [Variovorax boronicumulans]|uniref:DUF1566 domain-containing protein n=1 Tax=Variovorax boronicumulans TaxID=436515 RepID=UPI001C559749